MSFFTWFNKKQPVVPAEKIKEPEPIDLEDECRQYEVKIQHNMDFMRITGHSEEEIEEISNRMRDAFAKKNNLTYEELVDILLRVYERELVDEQRQQNKLIYEMLAKEDIEAAKMAGASPAELEELTFTKNIEINLLCSAHLEVLDSYYDAIIDQKQRDKINKYNDGILFDFCLRQDIIEHIKSEKWGKDQAFNYHEKRTQAYLAGKFDYPQVKKDLARMTIEAEDANKPEGQRRLKNPNSIIKYKDRVEKKRASLPKIESEVLNKIYKK